MKKILLIILLSITFTHTYSQQTKYEAVTTDGKSSTINVDTLNVYSGMTVSGEKKVVSEESLQVDNTTVTTGGKLKATANDAITVLDGTMVALGGEMQLNGAGQYAVRFTYDASGNRIRREKDDTVK